MIKTAPYILLLLLYSCNGEQEKKQAEKIELPAVHNNGQLISFPDTQSISFFKTERINNSDANADFTAIGKIGATISTSNSGAGQNLVLFENPDLAGSYTQLMQHQINIHQIRNINIKQKQIELNRIKDLYAHGAATGQDLLNAETALSMEETNLANEKAAIIEHEAKLKSGGFDPALLRNAQTGTAYIICDIPENQTSKITPKTNCNIVFASFPNEKYTGKIEDIADVVDNMTRMIKIRVAVNNSSSKLKAGMFANVSFGINEGKFLAVKGSSLITVQGKTYVFVKTSDKNFERKEIMPGPQLGNRVVVYSGLSADEDIAIEGVMQLKGLSFGY